MKTLPWGGLRLLLVNCYPLGSFYLVWKSGVSLPYSSKADWGFGEASCEFSALASLPGLDKVSNFLELQVLLA